MSSEVTTFQYTLKKGKMWGYRFEIATVDGVRKWESGRGFRTKGDASKAGREAQAQYENRGRVVSPSDISYSDFIDQWLQSIVGNVKSTTIANYRKKVDLYIRPHLGSYRLKAVHKSDLRELIKKLSESGCRTSESGLSKNTLSVIKGIMTKSFDFAVDEHYLSESPIYGKLPLPKENDYDSDGVSKSNTKPHVFIPQHRIDQIFARFPEKSSDHVAMMLGYKCGLRIGEAFAVCWDDIDFDKKTLSINRQIQWHQDGKKNADTRNSHDRRSKDVVNGESGFWYFSSPKYNSYRTIEVDDSMLDLLAREKAQQEKDAAYYAEEYFLYYQDFRGRIFSTKNNLPDEDGIKPVHLVSIRRDGEMITSRTMQHTSFVIHNDLGYPEFDFHSLRHTHATMLAEHGATPMYVKNRLGHKNLDVTIRVYYHYTDVMGEQGAKVLKDMY